YSLLARARLRAAGETVPLALPASELALPRLTPKLLRDPAVERADALDRAGLGVEAGIDLQRHEEALEARLGRDAALVVLLDRYPRYQAYRRAYQLAGTRAGTALQAAPSKGKSARLIWEAAHPRAWPALVEKDSKAGAVPPMFVWSIMHK